MNWSEYFESGALIQIDATHYLLMRGPFTQQSQPAEGKACLFRSDFFLNEENPWWVPQDSEVFSRSELQMVARPYLVHWQDGKVSGQQSWQWQRADRSLFEKSFAQVKADIAAGELQKAVPITVESAEGRPNVQTLFAKAVFAPESLWAYGCWSAEGGEGIFGLTPEVLFSQRDDELEVYALAGTRPKNDGSRTPLSEDEKELKEHRFVVEAIEKKLRAHGSVRVSDCEVLSLPSMEHLRTTLQVSPVKAEFAELVKDLHPTPALGTYPPSKGLGYLSALEGQPERRRGFGAPFGVLQGRAKAVCLVAIRCVQWQEGKTDLFSGCGVVEQSELEREWQELSLKRQSVKDFFGLSTVDASERPG